MDRPVITFRSGFLKDIVQENFFPPIRVQFFGSLGSARDRRTFLILFDQLPFLNRHLLISPATY